MLGKHLPNLVKRETALAKSYDRIQFVDGRSVKKKELRASAFPVCPLLFLESYLFPTAIYGNTYHSEYHTQVGHFVHAYLQERMVPAADGLIFGDWKCPNCQRTESLSSDPVCPDCGTQMTYEEISVDFEGVLTGHIDGVLLYFDRNAQRQVIRVRAQVFDYKTCSYADARNLPTAKHLLQTAIYTVLLETKIRAAIRQQGYIATLAGEVELDSNVEVLVDSMSVLYVPKDKPSKRLEFNIAFTDKLRHDATAMIEWGVDGYVVFQELVGLLDKPLEERKANQAEIQRLLAELYAYRTCNAAQRIAPELTPLQFYEQEVKPFFFEKIELDDEKTKFVRECPRDKLCFNRSEWMNSVYGDAIYGSRESTVGPEKAVSRAKHKLLI